MQEYARLGLIDHGNELVGMRAPNSKTFDLGNNQYQLEQTMGLLHYNDNGLNDIDLEPVDNGDYWTLTKAPYIAQISKGIPQISLTDRATGFIYNLALASIDASDFKSPDCVPEEHPNGHALTFLGLLGDGDLSIVLTPGAIKTQQLIRSFNGIRTLLWNISQTNPDPMMVETLLRANDANDAKIGSNIVRSPLIQDGNNWIGTFQELVIPQLITLDKKTRVSSLSQSSATFPLTVIS